MNIGSLIRGLLGDTKAGETKQLDMKTGQVVRGVVLSVSDDGQEAVVQIQGVKVRAALETPLQAGQATLLQVQEPGEGGMVMLKPLAESPYMSIPNQSLASVLESFGLQDTQGNRDLVQTIQSSGVPLTKENIALFKEALALKPASISAEKWIQSAAIAFQRGLPMTTESIKGLHQAVFGPPMHELLGVLEEQLNTVITSSSLAGKTDSITTGANPAAMKSELVQQTQPSAKGEPNVGGSSHSQSVPASEAPATTQGAGLQQLATKLQNLLQQLRTLPLQASPAQVATGADLASQPGPPAANIAPQPSAAGAAMPKTEAAAPQGSAAALAQPAQAASTASEGTVVPSPKTPLAQGEQPWVGRLLKLLGAEHEQQAVRGAAAPAPQAPQGQTAADAAGDSRPTTTAAASQAAAGARTAAEGAAGATASLTGAAVPSASAQPAASPMPAGQEHASRAATVQQAVAQSASALQGLTAALPSEHHAGSQESIKGVLLQLVNRDDVPPVLREAAQQLVQHLTGQQLLLNTDRTAPFAQVTLFIPLNGADGQETASVQIQSRRGRKGELDSSNCHLWFDLQMKNLGQTLVDVQVVDHIVSLKVHNNNDWAAPLLEDHRDEISSAMESLGYHLLTLKAEPLPASLTSKSSDGSTSATTADYVPQSYKGVDMRV